MSIRLKITTFRDSSYASNGHVFLISGTWITEYLNEVEAFPYIQHDNVHCAECDGFLGKNRNFGRGE